MIALIAALAGEASGILELLAAEGPVRQDSRYGRPLAYGRLAGQEVVVAISGVGKVAAALTATLLAEQATALIVIGTAGGLAKQVNPGDIVVATAALQHDLDARPLFDRWVQPDLNTSRFATNPALTNCLLEAADAVVAAPYPGQELGITKPRRLAGLVVSGDAFVGSQEVAWRLRNDLPEALTVDMESAAIAQVATMADLPCGIIRTISDRANGKASVDFARFLPTVAAPVHAALAAAAVAALVG